MIQGGGQRGFQACVSLHRYDTIRYVLTMWLLSNGVYKKHFKDGEFLSEAYVWFAEDFRYKLQSVECYGLNSNVA